MYLYWLCDLRKYNLSLSLGRESITEGACTTEKKSGFVAFSLFEEKARTQMIHR
jgi:hypothetical protein